MFPFVVFAPCSFSVGEVRFLKPGLWLHIPFGFNLGPSWSIQSSCGYLRGITKIEESHLRRQIQPCIYKGKNTPRNVFFLQF